MFSLLVRRDSMIDPPQMDELDTHCHILPGLDDGPPDAAAALAIAKTLVEMGIKTVVATPHIISDIYPLKTTEILEAVAQTRELFKTERVELNIIAGAEYYVEQDFLDRIDQRDILSWGADNNVLFESPVEQEPILLTETIFRLKSAGFTPVLAHAERYRFLQGDMDRVGDIRRMGAKLQVNHPSFHLPKMSRRGEMARRLYIKGMVDFLGTDMHRASRTESARSDRAKADLRY